MNKIKKIFSVKMLIFLVVISAISILLKSYNFFIISLSIIFLFKFIKLIINNRIFDSHIFTFILVFFSYFSLLQCVVLTSWLINKNFPLDATPILLLVIILIMYLYKYLINQKNERISVISSENKFFKYTDIIALIVPLVICMVIFIAPIKSADGNIKSTLTISMINGNVDDAAHLALINDRIQFNRGVLLGSDAINKTRSQGFYPTGWHSITAVIIKVISPSINVGIESLVAFGILKFFWFFVLFYLIIRSSFTLFNFVSDKKLNKSSAFFITSFSTLFGCLLVIPMLREGFYSFIPQLITAVLSLLILAQTWDDNQSEKSYKSIPLLLIVGVGGCLSWLLPLPAFCLAILMIIIFLLKDKKISDFVKNLFRIIYDNLIILLLLALAVIVQLFVMLSNNSSESVSLSQGLTLNGGIETYGYLFKIILCIGFVSYLAFCDNKFKKNIMIILSLVLSLILFCSLIGVIQITQIGKVDYYFYKSFDILTIVMIPFCAIGFDQIIKKISQFYQLIIPIIFLSGTFLLLLPEITIFPYSAGYRHLSSQLEKSLFDELSNDITQSNYFNKKFVFYYVPGTDNYFAGEVANYIAKSNEMNGTCFGNVKQSIWSSPKIEDLISKINQECAGYKVDIITNIDNYNPFASAVSQTNLNDSLITVKHY